MKFVKERVNVICQELARLSISQKIKITDMQVKNGCYITPAEADASKEPWTSFDTVNDRWYGPDITGSAPPSPFRRVSMEKISG